MKTRPSPFYLSTKEYDRTILLAQGHTNLYVAGKAKVGEDAIYRMIEVLKKRFMVDSTNSLFFILGFMNLIPSDIIMAGMQNHPKE